MEENEEEIIEENEEEDFYDENLIANSDKYTTVNLLNIFFLQIFSYLRLVQGVLITCNSQKFLLIILSKKLEKKNLMIK